MVNATTTTDFIVPEARQDEQAKGILGRFMDGLIAAREREARREIRQFFAGQSDAQLVKLGFTAGEIERLRAGGQVNLKLE